MTALGTIMSMLPIAVEQAIGLERLSPLAVVAIGGLFVSTLLTLVCVPLFYTLVEDFREKYNIFKKDIPLCQLNLTWFTFSRYTDI